METNPFTSQMDYIYFCYGLGFLLLAAVCLAPARNPRGPLLWRWLGLFGLLHGANVWTHLLRMAVGGSPALGVASASLTALSFLCLYEFGRSALAAAPGGSRRFWTHPGILWALLGLALLAGKATGLEGFAAAARYLVAAPAAALGVLAFALAPAPTRSIRLALRAAAVLLGAYGAATGLIPAPSRLFPAHLVNEASFLALFGVPVQLVRGILALLLAAAVYVATQTAQEAADAPDPSTRSQRDRRTLAVGLLLLLLLGLGWLVAQQLEARARRNLRYEYQSHLRILGELLSSDVRDTDHLVRLIAGSPSVLAHFARPGSDAGPLDLVLDRYSRVFPDLICYVMALDGRVVASSNRSLPSSFVEQNYGFRPYFQQARSGKAGRYFALGVTSGERGYYAACPVAEPGGRPLGVAVIKRTLARENLFLRLSFPAFLVHRSGAVFLSSLESAPHRSLWPLTPAEATALADSKQFGPGPFEPLLPGRPRDADALEWRGRPALAVIQSVDLGEPWSLVAFAPLQVARVYRMLGIGLTMIASLLVVGAFAIWRVRHRGMDRLAASERRYRTLVEGSPGCICLLDDAGRFLSINAAGLLGLGLDPTSVHGSAFAGIWPAAARERVADALRRVWRGERVSFQEDYLRPDGIARVWQVALNPLPQADGKVLRCIGVFADMTEVRRMEEERRRLELRAQQAHRLESLGVMAGATAHHLNDILMVVQGNLEESADSLPADSLAADAIEQAQIGVRRAAELGTLMLTYAGQTNRRNERLDLAALARESAGALAPTLPDRIPFESRIPLEPAWIVGDPAQIRQILTNLLANALEAIPEERSGSITLSVGVRTCTREDLAHLAQPPEGLPAGPYAFLEVSDTGSGMEPATLDRIFEPFFSTKFPGRGLGLATVLGILRAHKGGVRVESAPGRGATFRVWLPQPPER